MSDLTTQFEDAQVRVKQLTSMPSTDNLLKLYGLYKQASAGDVNTSQPWAVQIEARAKWDAWNKCKGMSNRPAQYRFYGQKRSFRR
jgi:diazepam-binding inhibitor (GABA receptor modulating acyl-CoA-binding protein)